MTNNLKCTTAVNKLYRNMNKKVKKEKRVFGICTTRLSNKSKSIHLEILSKIITEKENNRKEINPTRLKRNSVTSLKSVAALIEFDLFPRTSNVK